MLTVFCISKRLVSNVYLLKYSPAKGFERSAIKRFFHPGLHRLGETMPRGITPEVDCPLQNAIGQKAGKYCLYGPSHEASRKQYFYSRRRVPDECVICSGYIKMRRAASVEYQSKGTRSSALDEPVNVPERTTLGCIGLIPISLYRGPGKLAKIIVCSFCITETDSLLNFPTRQKEAPC